MTSFPCKYFNMRITSFRDQFIFQLLICSISWFRYIDIYCDDIIIVEVMMTRKKFQELLNPVSQFSRHLYRF